MKKIKITSVLLVVVLCLGLHITAREKAPGNKDKKNAKDLFKEAKSSIYKKDWSKAVKQFQEIAEVFSDTKFSDESLYWLGYSMNRLSQGLGNLDQVLEIQEKALSRLDTLMQHYPESKWVDDAKLLRVEIAEVLVKMGFKQFKYILNGASKDPDTEMKLVALDALMHMDKEQALPVLERIIRSHKNPEVRERAIFVLSQNDDPRVVPLLVEVVLKDTDRNARKKAIFWLGQIHGPEILNQLVKIYKDIRDIELKEKVIFSISQHDSDKGAAQLIRLYREEQSIELKKKIIFWLGQSNSEEARQFIEKILME